MKEQKDVLGFALQQYHQFNVVKPLFVRTSWTDYEEYEIPYFFRGLEEMPPLEQKAISMSKGKVLDVGAGTGIHSLALEHIGFDVKSIDISPYSVEIMKDRGLKNACLQDFYKLEKERFDTILFLMNGIGVVERVDNFENFFNQCGQLLKPGGQILCDSSDLIYLFEEEDGSFRINLNDRYYGEVDFFVEYDGIAEEPFPWLFIDFDNLKDQAEKFGWNAELVQAGEHYDFLARLTLKN